MTIWDYSRKNRILGYFRKSTNDQKEKDQKKAIKKYAKENSLTVDRWIENEAVAGKYDELKFLRKGDTVIVAELSRIGWSTGQIAMSVDELLKNEVKLICIKENMEFTDKKRIAKCKTIISMFSLFAEMEKELISERTKEGLARAKKDGKILGRPKGRLGKSKLDGKKEEIQGYFEKGVNKTNIARIFGVSVPTLKNFVRTRRIPTTKAIKVKLHLRVENNNKYVRGKKRAKENIEYFVLSRYNMKKLDKDGWEYELTIPYENDKDLDDTIYDMLSEIESKADYRNCFTEADVYAVDSDKSW